jgi:hypothetical protein
MTGERRLRLALGASGIALIGYGAFRILHASNATHPPQLAVWLTGSLLLHDVLIAPAAISVGWVLAHVLPPRARSYVQGGLVAAALVSVVAFVLIERRGRTASPALALLRQNYGANLLMLLLLIALVTASAYGVALMRVRRTNSLPPADQ